MERVGGMEMNGGEEGVAHINTHKYTHKYTHTHTHTHTHYTCVHTHTNTQRWVYSMILKQC